MNITAKEFQPYYITLYNKLKNKDFVIDKTGCKIVELIAPSVELSVTDFDNKPLEGFVDFRCRRSPRKYIEREFEWYRSHELHIGRVSDIKIWQRCCNDNKEINSNYGNLVFSKNNFNQFQSAANTLKAHQDSRQGIIIYTRPSMQVEWNHLNGSDFICTNFQHFMIRNNTLVCLTSMRSQDVIFGLFSDIPWFFYVYHEMLKELQKTYPDLSYGRFVMMYNSFHCYEQHFDKLAAIGEEDS